VDAGEFPNRVAAKARERELVRPISVQRPADRPSMSGRFLRGTMIVSVDIAQGAMRGRALPSENLS
jgi:hypothetical protein